MDKTAKPLGIKGYGSIQHLPGSRLGPGDHKANKGQARLCLINNESNGREYLITVQEKLDGSNCCVARIGEDILALTRSGYLATTSKYEQHHLFAHYVRLNANRFRDLLANGERAVGEWLAQAHGTLYNLRHEPFVCFDLMKEHVRSVAAEVSIRCASVGLTTPVTIHTGGAYSLARVLEDIKTSGHGAVGGAEGVVYRVELDGEVRFLAKWVKGDKQDGIYLPEVSGKQAIWNWRPTSEAS